MVNVRRVETVAALQQHGKRGFVELCMNLILSVSNFLVCPICAQFRR